MGIAARRRSAPLGVGSAPFVPPASSPYNAPTHLAIPSPDGSSKVVHPSVHDFGSGKKWHGFRYWMAMTPFPDSASELENPCILASNNWWDWAPPAGLVNPVFPSPFGTLFNSDPDLTYDPRSDELVLLYREQLMDGSHQGMYARSPDGATWPARPTPLNWTRPGGSGQVLSPCIIRRGEGDWLIYGIDYNPRTLIRWAAASPEGAFGTHAVCTGWPSGAIPWHFDVLWDGAKFWGITDHNNGTGVDNRYTVGTSTDGLAWSWDTTGVMRPIADSWQSQLYRPTLTLHENGTHMRVWYSVLGSDSWRTSYTELPVTLWPAPPA